MSATFREFIRVMREWTTKTEDELNELREFKANMEKYIPMLADMKPQWDQFKELEEKDQLRK